MRDTVSGISRNSTGSHISSRSIKRDETPTNNPDTIGENNQSKIKLATNPVLNVDSKHQLMFDKIQVKTVQLLYTSTNEVVLDILAQILPQPKLDGHFSWTNPDYTI